MKSLLLIIAVLGAVTLLYSCNRNKKCQAKDKEVAVTSTEETDSKSKEDRIEESVLNDVYGVVKVYDQVIKPEVGMTLELHLNESKVSGNGGCNQYRGAMELNEEAIKFSQVMGTKMACQNLDLEKSFFKALRYVNGYHFSKGTLFFTQDGTVLIEAKRMD